jgi:hexulose-6-phosphate isomerase
MCGVAIRETPVLHPDAAVRRRAIANLERALERTRWLGGSTVLLHPGQLKPETRYDAGWEWTRDALRACVPAAERTGVVLAIENVWNKFLLTPLEMQRLVDEVGHPLVGAYFDVGNCLIFGYAEQWIAILGTRIKMVHVKDFRREGNAGTNQDFCQLLDGDADYRQVMAELRRIGYDGYLTSEVGARHLPAGQTIKDTAHRIDAILAM